MVKRNSYTDVELIGMLERGDESAIEAIFRQYYQLVCHSIVRILPKENVVEDIAQEVFYELWKNRNSFKVSISLKAYLKRASLNRSLNHLRDKKIQWDDEDQLVHQQGTFTDASEQLQHEDLQKQIDFVIDNLPERCRIVFSLSRFEDMSHKEIAEELGISTKTVENHMTKALKILKHELAHLL